MLFQRIPCLAYAQNGYDIDAVGVFREMIMESMAFDQSAITSLLQVCSSFGHMRMAREVHYCALKTFFMLYALLLNATITVYSRCGDVTLSLGLKLPYGRDKKKIISSTALLACYAQNGLDQDMYSCSLGQRSREG
jgi:hypothetical protein